MVLLFSPCVQGGINLSFAFEIQQKILMEENNTQREMPQEDGVGDMKLLGENSGHALHSRRFSVNTYEYLLSSINMEWLSIVQYKPMSPVSI